MFVFAHHLPMKWHYQPQSLYNRRQDIHAHYGGQQQGGISTPAGAPCIFLFTGHGAKSVGYADEFQPDGSLRYTGEGQVGDMKMIRGNKAIRDSALNGRDLLVFEKAGSGAPVRYLGQFYCDGWTTERQPDALGTERDAIVFRLVPEVGLEKAMEEVVSDPAPAMSIGELRQLALAAATPTQSPTQSAGNVYKRSRDVRNYILARANGRCEACQAAAPFTTKAGAPYLEPHHIRRLSDGGPDHPRHVAGVCPNCHRRAHYGADAAAFNAALAAAVAKFEDSIWV